MKIFASTAAVGPCLLQSAAALQLFENSFGIPGVNASYDYIVIGGGTAGNTIAARLAQNSSISVAIIEAGGFYQIENGNGSVIPGLSRLQSVSADVNDTQPLIDWGFATTPQANLLPYFKKSITLTPPNTSVRARNATVLYDASAFDPSGGPLPVGWANHADPFWSLAQEAMVAAGIPISTLNFNSGVLNGSGYNPSTIDPQMRRSTSQSSFLQQAMEETGIKIYTHAFARQIKFDANKQATSVIVTSGQVNFTLSANKEIILSAGAFQSPQLLMVSGIGPAATLKTHGIPPVKILEGVGQNLWDHPLIGVAHRVSVNTASLMGNSPAAAAAADQQYLKNRTGPLTAPSGMMAWENLPQNLLSKSTIEALKQFPSDWPQAEYLPNPVYQGYNRNYRTADPQDGYNYATIAGTVVTTFSRGSVTISSRDMMDPPIIDPNWLTASEDMDLAIATFKRIREFWSKMGNLTIGPEYLPGPSVKTDAQILDFIRESTIELHHAAATCKMGQVNDMLAVVDSRARVIGVQGLRVVDASAFPFLTPGHPQSGVYMLAEKIADDILNGR
ncbi:hypothetical protein FKW77_001781 [Venturia effusa]|uniref:Glucose-methanol-choline oxidoreductase N-terminal domain-containing protein n=1 Tax=Venturia effusa TaxID=50376 RepID=A0A517LI55_9PEZI|nr:hypothetical protein FKW77_001781 [Venturia effusa]